MSDSPESRPKRQKRETSYRAKAFEKFKQLKSGARNKYEAEEVDNIYETVDEREYEKRVLSRQDDDWIVDDDGSGYVEDGREIFDDDLDVDSIEQARKQSGKGVKRKKKGIAESAVKGNLKYMISNMPAAKKKEEKKLEDDSALSELLDEIDDSPSTSVPRPIMKKPVDILKTKHQVTRDYLKSFKESRVKPAETNLPPVAKKSVLTEIQNKAEIPAKETAPIPTPVVEEPSSDTEPENEIRIEDCTITDDCFDDDLDISQIDDLENQHNETLSNDIQAEFLSEWENKINNEVDEPVLDAPLSDNKQVFRFFWWDAFEDPDSQKGVVYLFGKTFCEKTKNFVSCCVAVRDIPRRIFVLPRAYELDSHGNHTDKPVTQVDLYKEFNEKIMKPLNITSFKSKVVNKKYAFNPEIPAESEYMEVQYAAKYPAINLSSYKLRTISQVFGTNSSYLEILLLHRKIKGPCWLDLTDIVPVANPLSWCKLEFNCLKLTSINITPNEKPLPIPPLIVAAINLRTVTNPKTLHSEVVMMSCLVQKRYSVDKQAPEPPFQQHFCVFSGTRIQPLPRDLHAQLSKYKATQVQKVDSEQALINYFIMQFDKVDPDLIVGHDLQGYQINVLAESCTRLSVKHFSKFGRLKKSSTFKLDRTLFVGRLVCDIKLSAKELIRSRSYDLEALCQAVLKLKDGQRMELEPEEIPKMFETSKNILKLISFTMQDTSYILKIMYDLNVIPLALGITNIAGNVMSRTLMGGRSERNEFLLLHAFSEKDFIVPDKEYKRNSSKTAKSSNKKPTYSGGLVLDPKIGFYDKFILLMDFNSLYPSIIQEYNICFTTMPPATKEDAIILPDSSLPPGILPIEIRKLVESRKQVKNLMKNPDLSPDLRMQYNIRQMALKLTANSMYGCLGFSNSRFYAKNLAALVTHKGREILTNTKCLVEKMSLEVVYGDTDSIMINTNILDYEQVMKLGNKIKQEVNRIYKQVELDIDGVFKYLLLLKKKKYAAVTLSKQRNGELTTEKEYKGLDIVRRDWSQLASEAGKFILEHILSDQSADDRIEAIHTYLEKIRNDFDLNKVPVQLLVITKQLSKDPKLYPDVTALSHVQVALRYNQQFGGHLRGGDTVPYVICDDGSGKVATQRAYHIDEFKNSKTLKIDVNYYLSQQIHPVVARICGPIEGTDSYQIATHLGIDPSGFKQNNVQKSEQAEVFVRFEMKFQNADKFSFVCLACKARNTVGGALVENKPFLTVCGNNECKVRPIDYLPYIQQQLVMQIRAYVRQYYRNELICEDPACTNVTRWMPLRFSGKFPVCNLCCKAVLYKKYTEYDLYSQLMYFQQLFDLKKLAKKPMMEYDVHEGYIKLEETVKGYLNHSGYSFVNMCELFSGLKMKKEEGKSKKIQYEPYVAGFSDEEEDDL